MSKIKLKDELKVTKKGGVKGQGRVFQAEGTTRAKSIEGIAKREGSLLSAWSTVFLVVRQEVGEAEMGYSL